MMKAQFLKDIWDSAISIGNFFGLKTLNKYFTKMISNL